MAVDTAGLRAALAVLAALALVATLVAVAPPATAETEGGAGTVTGTEQPAAQVEQDPPVPPGVPLFCAEVTPGAGNLMYDLAGEGTYTGLTEGDSPPAIYSTTIGGVPLDIKVEANSATGSYYIAPEGTYTQDQCEAGPEAPGAGDIPVDVSVQASPHVEDSGGGPCDGTGTFRRVNTTVVFEWELTEDCEVNGNVPPFDQDGRAPEGTWHSIEGDLTPCFQDPFTQTVDTCAEPADEIQLVGAYQQTLHSGSPLP